MELELSRFAPIMVHSLSENRLTEKATIADTGRTIHKIVMINCDSRPNSHFASTVISKFSACLLRACHLVICVLLVILCVSRYLIEIIRVRAKWFYKVELIE